MNEDEADVPVILNSDGSKPAIEGVGVLRYPVNLCEPTDQGYRKMARHIADFIRQGTILALPNTKDAAGDFLWDFRIEGGDPGQVKIVRGKE